MAYENSAGIGVSNQYGPRNTGGAAGTQHSKNSLQTLVYDFTGEMLNSTYAPPVYMPKGAKVVRGTLVVDEAFVVSTSGTVSIGGTAPGTDGFVLTEAQLEALGTKDVSSVAAGTWATNSATGTSASQKLAKSISGTVGATSGKGKLIVEYVRGTDL